ncbi:MAG: 16S rRNA (cytidine(1402)-2'-O)-methyltransferase [Pseudomonadota bacterium]
MADRRESKRRPQPSRASSPGSVAPSQRSPGGLAPGLWLVATPIGNASDITLRALDVLRKADVIACEDTRRTRKLMDIHAIPLNGRRLISYNDRNGAGRRPQIEALLAENASIAYASDAGTPMIADPGYRLVEVARELGAPVQAVPGASAAITALMVAGLPTDRFLFLGFLPPKTVARRKELEEIAALRTTLVLFESPRRLGALLSDATSVLGATRACAVIRELTKTYEEVRHGTLHDLAEVYAEDPPKGEIVVVVGPPDRNSADQEHSEEDLDRLLSDALRSHSVKEAAKIVADETGHPKRTLYSRAVELSRGFTES